MENISDRIALFAKEKGLSIRAIEQQIGCSNGVLARCVSKGTDISSSWVSKIIETYKDLSPNWLLIGEGAMLRPVPSSVPDTMAHVTRKPGEGIPLIPISAMAGAFSGDQQVMEYECERYVVPVFKGADFLISVKGSSMYPKYNSGDIVACKRLSMSDLFFQWNKVYVLDTDQGPLIKRVKPGSDKEHITIVSDNAQYEPFELSLSHIYHVALVIGVIRLE